MDIVVHSYCLKGVRQEALLPPVTLTPICSTLTVTELIRLAVAQQIVALSAQHRLEQASVREVLDRQYLSEGEILKQSREGAIVMPQASASADLNVGAEVERALKGFERRAFRVLHNGVMLQSLDEPIELSSSSALAFIRLMPLIGG